MIGQMVSSGVPLSKKFAEKPTIHLGLMLYYNAFQDLSTCRQLGMSIGLIPWTATRQYADDMEINEI